MWKKCILCNNLMKWCIICKEVQNAFIKRGIGEEIDEDDIQALEEGIIKLENMLPMYIKLLEMRGALDEKEDDFFNGLFGGGR